VAPARALRGNAPGAALLPPGAPVPGLIVLDLDACLWLPEMFELAGAPCEPGDSPTEVRTIAGERVKMIPSAVEALELLAADPQLAKVGQRRQDQGPWLPKFSDHFLSFDYEIG